jgi:hypothetical protein
MKRILVLVVATATVDLLGGVARAQAAPAQGTPITYTETAIATGTLGESSFSDALVTLTLTGDTSGVGPGPGPLSSCLVNVGTADVTVDGLGTATLTGTIEVVSCSFSGMPVVIIAQWDVPPDDGTSITHILGLTDDSLADYDLQSPLGPISGLGFGVADSGIYPTTAGDLILSSGGDPVTLTVNTANPVPKPASLLLLGTGGRSLITR